MEQKKQSLLQWIWDTAKDFLITFVVCYLLVQFVFQPVIVHGTSMYPTLNSRQIGIMLVYPIKLKQIDRFDIISSHHGDEDFTYIKRVIGLPFDRVSAKDGVVYVNGEAIDEPYLDTEFVSSYEANGKHFTQDFEEVVLQEDEYFLLGDNRPVSEDSRFIGPFSYQEMVAKDIFTLPFRWPWGE